MNNDKTMRRVLLLSGMAALLLMAFLLDYVILGMQMRLSAEGGANLESTLIVLFSVFELLVALGGLALFHYLVSSGGNTGIAIGFIIVGLVVLAATPLLYFLPVPVEMYSLVQFVQPRSYLFHAGAILMGAGVLSLLVNRRR